MIFVEGCPGLSAGLYVEQESMISAALAADGAEQM